MVSGLLNGFTPTDPGPLPHWIGPGLAALLLAIGFSTFAGGLALAAVPERFGHVAKAVVVISGGYGGLAYAIDAYAEPYATFYGRSAAFRAAVYPLGPTTPGVIAELRDSVLANGATTTVPDTSQPLGIPDSWHTFLINSNRAFVVQVILNGLLGLLVGYLTFGLSPPLRRNGRWTIGVLSAFAWLAFTSLLTGRMADGAVLFNPYLHSWGSITLHLAFVAILIPIVRERARD